MNGKVKWFSDEKGFGFIEQEDGPDVFLHITALNFDRDGSRLLSNGDRVSFDVVDAEKGLRATNVVVLD